MKQERDVSLDLADSEYDQFSEALKSEIARDDDNSDGLDGENIQTACWAWSDRHAGADRRGH